MTSKLNEYQRGILEDAARVSRKLKAAPHTVPSLEPATTTPIGNGNAAPGPKYFCVGIYEMTKSGLFTIKPKRKGGKRKDEEVDYEAEEMETKQMSAAFEILGRVRDPRGEGWARLLQWKDADNKTHQYAVSDRELHGDHRVLFGELASRGLYITTTNSDRAHLIHYLNAVEVTDKVTEVATTGWHIVKGQKVFALPDGVMGTVKGETIIVRGADDNSPFEKRGTLDDWKNSVGKRVAGHTRGVFAVSAAFAPVLLGPLDAEGGGFHSYGKSSIGKTTFTAAAASVWGKGAINPGFMLGWRATANSLESNAAMHTDVILPLDEIGAGEARDVALAVYSLSSGIGKGRANREGRARRSVTWRTLIISTGEMRLTDKLIEDKRQPRVGQQVRLVDIPADAGKGFGVFDSAAGETSSQVLADKIKVAAQTYYGTAGPEFARKLIEQDTIGNVKEMVEAFRSANVPEGAGSQVLRVLDRFGIVAAAGELAIQFGIVPWAAGAAINASKVCFDAWFAERGGAGAGEDMAAIAKVRHFIEKHGEARFEPVTGSTGIPVRDRAGWRRGEGDAEQWMIPPQTWRTEVCAGLNPTDVGKALAKHGMLLPGQGDKLSRSERIHEGESTKRVYVVTAAILAGEDDDG
jgi:putative DNA primase/helicase